MKPKRLRAMKIDAHAHFIPKEAVKKLGELGVEIVRLGDDVYQLKIGEQRVGPLPMGAFDVEARLRHMDQSGIDVNILSPTHHLFMYKRDVEVARRAARIQNEAIAEAVKKAPDRFVGNAAIPLQDAGAAVEELEYAVDKLGLRGVEIGTNVAGKNLDSSELYPVYEKAQDLGLPIFVHPNDIMSPDRHKRYYSHIVVGTLAETTLAIASVMYGGVLDRFPRLRFVFSHGGAAFPYQLGRLQRGAETRDEVKENMKRGRVEAYLDALYFDSVLFSKHALQYLVSIVPVDRVLLGTDYPFKMGDWDAAKLVESLEGLSSHEKDKILSANARRLYKL